MSKTYCYIRISTDKQEYNRQVQIFKDKGYINSVNCEYIEETFTGTKTKRPEFDKLIKKMEKGDTLVCESLSRLSRGGVIKTLDLITEFIQKKQINVIILKENFNLLAGEKPDANTNLLLGIFSVLGQFERDLISERTKEGLKAVKTKGTRLGKPKGQYNTKENFIVTLEKMLDKNIGQSKACLYTRFPKKSFQKCIKKCYSKYNTKDYQEILSNIRKDATKWEQFY
jgi:DNA invertase Pin-like site-specific DNA recombinase|nr:MAG TPA: integrase [Bacteriophage sp.]